MNAEDAEAAIRNANLLSSQNAELDQLRNRANELGYSVSADGSTVTGPDGKTYPASAFASPQAMADAGFSQAAIDSAQGAMKAANAKAADRARVVAMQTEGGGGGGAAAAGGGRGGGSNGAAGPDWSKLFGDQQKAQVNKVNPMIINNEGEPVIGANGDIFKAMSVRYASEVASGRTGFQGAVARPAAAPLPRKPSSFNQPMKYD